jgi:hypothetical protein
VIQDFDPEDRDFIERMLGTGEIPSDVYAEYIQLRRMGEVCHRRDEKLGFFECRTMLRRLGYGLPEQFARDVNWRLLPRGTRVVVDKPNCDPWIGYYDGSVDIGTVGIKPELKQPETKEVDRKHCRIWMGETVEELKAESHKSIVPSDEDMAYWQGLPVDTPVKVTRMNGEVTEGSYRGTNGKRLQIKVGDKLFNYAPKSVEVAELAEV